MLATLQQKREASDYDDFYIASKEEAEVQCANPEHIINVVKQYLIDEFGMELA